MNDIPTIDRAAPGDLALAVFHLDQELRADREPPLTCYEFRAKYDERQRLLASLGWRPNMGK